MTPIIIFLAYYAWSEYNIFSTNLRKAGDLSFSVGLIVGFVIRQTIILGCLYWGGFFSLT